MTRYALALLLVLTSCVHTYHGTIDVEVAGDRAFDVKVAALSAASRWAACGYGTSLPDRIIITEALLNEVPNQFLKICARAEVHGVRVVLEESSPCPDYEATLGHEFLHLIGFDHTTPEDYCNFNRVLAACGFNIRYSGPTECRNF